MVEDDDERMPELSTRKRVYYRVQPSGEEGFVSVHLRGKLSRIATVSNWSYHGGRFSLSVQLRDAIRAGRHLPLRDLPLEPDEKELFLRLYYRERVGRLAQTLALQAQTPEAGVMTTKEIADHLARFVKEAEDEKLCHNMCKDMYFCNRRRNHKGQHSEDGVLFWD